eukprot:TRINITY_DN18955_c0_g1_i3.p1 TRINITY_DN18955_c0_g1~~TRINITY_DN18955_c0_g1_i3.p1  ORF type:complete len:523 (+),score=154.45 TRINITY_DN18955_c0_g1_i3:51-1619(+)
MRRSGPRCCLPVHAIEPPGPGAELRDGRSQRVGRSVGACTELDSWRRQRLVVSPHHVADVQRRLGSSEVVSPAVVDYLLEQARGWKTPLLPDVVSVLVRLAAHIDDEAALRRMAAEIAPHAGSCLQPVSARALAAALYGLRFARSSEEVDRLLHGIGLMAQGSTHRLNTAEFSSALQGLQRKRDCSGVRMLLVELTRQSARLGRLDSRAVAALGALRSLEPTAELHAMLHCLAGLVRGAEPAGDRLSAGRELSGALHGLQQQPDTATTRALVAAVASRATQAGAELDAQGVSSALFGLQSLALSVEVGTALDAVAAAALRCKEPLRPHQLGAALYGLQRMRESARSDRVVAVLQGMLPGVEGPLTSRDVACALFGLQKRAGNSRTRRLLLALAPHISRPGGALTAQAVGMSIYGLQSLEPSVEVAGVLSSLAPRLGSDIDPPAVAMALHGMANFVRRVDVAGIFETLAAAARRSSGHFASAQTMSMALFGLLRSGGKWGSAASPGDTLTQVTCGQCSMRWRH